MSISATAVRRESDLVGGCQLPAQARYGVHTLRAAENFARPQAQRLCDVPELCRALGMVKLAAVRANRDAGTVPKAIADVIEQATGEFIGGAHDLWADLIVPLVQGGAGTSTNMNVNEVIANRALELLGHQPGDYRRCHPNDHVNRSQSTNDVYPTAMRVAILLRSTRVERAAQALEAELRSKADRYELTPKLGRTQLQDAVAMTVGEEFAAWADSVGAARRVIVDQREALLEVNLGGTAIGTGLTAPQRYRERVIAYLAQISGLAVRPAVRGVSATTDPSALLGCSAAVRGLAVSLAKIANDLRLLSSGPHGGLGELHLPAVQSGSSMMPGKVNPVIAEFVNQLAFRIRGRDATIVAALDAGQLQLNAMLPLVASELLAGQEDVCCAMVALRVRCVEGIVVDVGRNAEFVGHDLGALSSMASEHGYVAATQQARRAGLTDDRAPTADAGRNDRTRQGLTLAHDHEEEEETCHD